MMIPMLTETLNLGNNGSASTGIWANGAEFLVVTFTGSVTRKTKTGAAAWIIARIGVERFAQLTPRTEAGRVLQAKAVKEHARDAGFGELMTSNRVVRRFK